MYNYENVQNGKTLKWEVRLRMHKSNAGDDDFDCDCDRYLSWPKQIPAIKRKPHILIFPPKKPFYAQNSFSGLYLAICLETDFPHKRDKSKRGLRMDESRHYNSKNVGDNKSFALGTLPLLRYCHTPLFDIHCMY